MHFKNSKNKTITDITGQEAVFYRLRVVFCPGLSLHAVDLKTALIHVNAVYNHFLRQQRRNPKSKLIGVSEYLEFYVRMCVENLVTLLIYTKETRKSEFYS